jgi:steroid Delta-isomerase
LNGSRNEARGVEAIARVCAHLFEQLAACGFVITETLVEGDGALLVCDFTFRSRRWRPRATRTIHGATPFKFAPDGRIAYHRDYSDAAEELYAKLPLIRPVLRLLRKFVA